MAAKKYRAITGLTLKDGSRVEPGEVFPGKPPTWLVEQGKVHPEGEPRYKATVGLHLLDGSRLGVGDYYPGPVPAKLIKAGHVEEA